MKVELGSENGIVFFTSDVQGVATESPAHDLIITILFLKLIVRIRSPTSPYGLFSLDMEVAPSCAGQGVWLRNVCALSHRGRAARCARQVNIPCTSVTLDMSQAVRS